MDAGSPDLRLETDDELSDEALYLRFRNEGDSAAFTQIVRRYDRPLHAHLRRYLGDADDADEVFQETFLKAFRSARTFDDGKVFRSWIFGVATNAAVDHLRRNKRRTHLSLQTKGTNDRNDEGAGTLQDLLEDRLPGPDEQQEIRERGAWVRARLDALSQDLQIPLRMVFFGGLKYREAADRLNIPLGTVKSRIYNAISQIRVSCGQTVG